MNVMKKEFWVYLVYYSNTSVAISQDGYTSLDRAIFTIEQRAGEGNWVDSFNFITKTCVRYELKCITVED
jgi:hypothetical protein